MNVKYFANIRAQRFRRAENLANEKVEHAMSIRYDRTNAQHITFNVNAKWVLQKLNVIRHRKLTEINFPKISFKNYMEFPETDLDFLL